MRAGEVARATAAWRTTGTPRPWTNMLSGRVSWLTGHSCCPVFPKLFGASVTFVGQRLAAYSRGGSAGITPASLLAPDQAGPGEPRQLLISARRLLRQPLELSLRHPFRNNRLDDGGIQRLVVVQAYRCVKLRTGLHSVDDLVRSAIACDRGVKLLLRFIRDAQRRYRPDHHRIAHRLEFGRRKK